MAEPIRIQTTLPETTGINGARPARQPDPSELTGLPLGVPTAGESEFGHGLPSYRDAVYRQFLRQMQAMPDFVRPYQKLLLESMTRQGGKAGAAGSAGFALPVPAQVADAAELAQAFRQEAAGLTRFGGPLFAVLQGWLSETEPGGETQERLGALLREYERWFSRPAARDALLQTLKSLEARLPRAYAETLSSKRAALEQLPAGEAERLTDALKQEVLPFLKGYVEKTNDYGAAREWISLLVDTLANAEGGARDTVAARWGALLRHVQMRRGLSPEQAAELNRAFAQAVSREPQKAENDPRERALAELLNARWGGGVPGGAPAPGREELYSLLLGQSVLMPYFHLALPVEYRGQALVSDVWIEKRDGRGAGGESGEQEPVRLLLSFDIPSAGAFEAALELRGRTVSLRMDCPAALGGRLSEISAKAKEILRNNGLNPGSLSVSADRSFRLAGEMLRTVRERGKGLDVRI